MASASAFAQATTSDLPEIPEAWLGVGMTLQQGTNGQHFIHVQQLAPGGPAEKAGVKPLDVVTTIDGKPAAFPNELAVLDYFRSLKVGQKVRFGILRGTESKELTVVAIPIPEASRQRWTTIYALAKKKAAEQQRQ